MNKCFRFGALALMAILALGIVLTFGPLAAKADELPFTCGNFEDCDAIFSNMPSQDAAVTALVSSVITYGNAFGDYVLLENTDGTEAQCTMGNSDASFDDGAQAGLDGWITIFLGIGAVCY